MERKRSSGKSDIEENLKTLTFTDVREAAYMHMTVNSYFTNKEKNSDFSLQSRAEMNSLAVGHGRAGCEIQSVQEKAFCNMEYAKTESVVIVQSGFHRRYSKDPPQHK
jgi:hypothetical protein